MTGPSSFVTLVHGLGGTAATMAPLATALGAPTTCPTLPGHGTTSDELERVTWGAWVSAVRAASSPVLVGQSLGALLALAVADVDPSIDLVVALSTPTVDDDVLDGIEWQIGRGHRQFETALAAGEPGYPHVPLVAVREMVRGALDLRLDDIAADVLVVEGALDDTRDDGALDAFVARLQRRPVGRTVRLTLPRSGHVVSRGPDLDELVAAIREMRHR